MRNSSALTGVAAAICVAACSVGSPRGGTFGLGPDSLGRTEGSTGESGAADAGSSTSGTRPAESDPPPTTGTTPVRCGKIDLLVVVETAIGSHEQWGYHSWPVDLTSGFGVLVSELYVTIAVEDFRIMVVPSSPAPVEVWCDDPVGGSTGAGYECPEVLFDACDETVGAGFNGFAVPEYEQSECMAGRYLESGVPNLASTLHCLLHGESYFDEPVVQEPAKDTLMDAMTRAVSPEGDAAACNDGFFRDDALLVVVALSADADPQTESSAGGPAAWKQALVEAKGGAEGNIVMVTLGPDSDQPGALCSATQTAGWPAKLREFTESFTNSTWNSACLPSYDPFFAEAAKVVDDACENFTPAS